MTKISNKMLAKYAVDQLDKKVPATTVAKNIAALLVAERRSKDATVVFRAIDKEFSARGRTRVTITSVHEVSDSVKHQLAELLKVSNPVFESEIDPTIIGGVNARAGEAQVDLTVRSKINRFKQRVTM